VRTCNVDGCEKGHLARGLCSKHYHRLRVRGLLVREDVCGVDGCGRGHYAKGLCSKHYMRLRKKGFPTVRTPQDPNEFVDCGEYWEIKLYDIKCNYVASAKIDTEDVEKCKQYKWHLNAYGYVISSAERILLHRFILDLTDPLIEGDHKFGDLLDNRKSQLRICNRAQNNQNSRTPKNNTSGERNVYWDKSIGRWRVIIDANSKRYYFGLYDDFEIACQVARAERKRLHGEFTKET